MADGFLTLRPGLYLRQLQRVAMTRDEPLSHQREEAMEPLPPEVLLYAPAASE